MRDRHALCPAPAVICLVALALPSCSHLHPPPAAPWVSGDLAAVECAGETPETLAPTAGRLLDPEAESITAWLDALAGDDEEASRLRAFFRCVAERSAGDDPADLRHAPSQSRP